MKRIMLLILSLPVALSLPAAQTYAGEPAQAADAKSGPIYYVNRTESEIKIEGRYLINEDGDKEAHSDIQWVVKPGQQGYLTVKGKKLVASKFAYTLTTASGSSDWMGTANVLDKDGDFVLVLAADDLEQHRKQTGGKPADDGKATLKARRTKEAWDEMGKVDARTSPIAKRDAAEYWEKFNVGYGSIDKDDIDADLDSLIRDWVSLSSDYQETIVEYERARTSLVNKRDGLGACPTDAGPAFFWGLAFGGLTREISDLDDQYRTTIAGRSRTKADLEKREGKLAQSLAARYPSYHFSR